MSEWSKDIVNDLEKVNRKLLPLNEFVNKHWTRFKPVYIHFHGYIEDEGELYLLVYEFFNKIIRSDVQPLFQSDNQIFNYFKTAVRNRNYDITHKKEIQSITFTEYSKLFGEDNIIEDKISLDETPINERIANEEYIDYIFKELSKTLAEPYIKLLILLYKGYTPKEARKELGVSLTTVRDRIGVIRDALRTQLKINKKN